MSVFIDIREMHTKFDMHKFIKTATNREILQYLKFRVNFIEEEFEELKEAINDRNSDDVVDALIDMMVVIIGTLDLFDVDGQKAWNEVHKANMSKVAGSNSNRPNDFGFPDLVKPDGWKTPSHYANTGELNYGFED